MTTSKKQRTARPPARKPFAETPREAYLLAAHITEAGKYLEKQERLLRGSYGDASAGVRKVLVEQLERLDATRKRFETRLLVDPAGAVEELTRIRAEFLDVRGARLVRGSDAAESAALGRAVVHVAEWLRRRQRGEHRGFAMPVATLGPISKVRPVRNEEELEALARSGPVRKILDGKDGETGPKKAAIALVALATGVGEQTVKRAAGSLRAQD